MPGYGEFARFYDGLLASMIPPDSRGGNPFAARVRGCTARYAPAAGSLLELGCGTGTILAGLPGIGDLAGLDASPGALAIARGKVPRAVFTEGDMAEFDLGRRFDVVACVFDSVNHLTGFSQWLSMFGCVRGHLAGGGLFIFDVLTTGAFRHYTGEPHVSDGDGDTLIAAVRCLDGGLAEWDMRVFEHLGGDRYRRHHERFRELAVPLDRITAALAPGFDLLELTDRAGAPATDDSGRAYFAAARR